MLQFDLNADLGEGMGNDEALMPFITSANIACGYHAGDEQTMRKTILLCQKYNIAIGAHPSYPDKENFGRVEPDASGAQVYDWVKEQIFLFKDICGAYKGRLHHVKPHGALYNRSAKDEVIAQAIVNAIKDTDHQLILYGLSGSQLIREGINAGLHTASEVFADRTYQDDGSLTSRSEPNALIEDEEISLKQIMQIVNEGSVTTVSGKVITLTAHTICLHGDGKNAVALAKKIYEGLQACGIKITSKLFT